MKFINKNNPDDIKGFIQLLKDTKKDFTVSQTSYSLAVDFKGQQFMYMDKLTSGNCFMSYNAIKRDIFNSDVIIDKIPRLSIRYYGVNEFFRKKKELPTEVVNIDINSAYLTVLLNAGMITYQTYERVTRSGKMNRLKSVGMLATKKHVLHYEGGKLVNQTVKTDEYYRNYFFYCCYVVGETMNKIAGLLGEQFLFFWVDGIYCTPDTDPNYVKQLLTDAGFTSKSSYLTNCNFLTQNENVYFDYLCTETNKRKTFCLPLENEENIENIKQFIKILSNEQLTKFNNL